MPLLVKSGRYVPIACLYSCIYSLSNACRLATEAAVFGASAEAPGAVHLEHIMYLAV